MKNQKYTGTPTSTRFALCPTTVKAGDPVLLGSIPAVALNDYSALTSGTVFYTNGSFNLSVEAASVLSPVTGAAIHPGDPIYLSGGSLDTGTNVTTGGTLCAVSGGTLFGELDPDEATITSATTATVGVKIGG